jgi:hypothetical protein
MFGKHNCCAALNKNNTLAILQLAGRSTGQAPAVGNGQNPPQKLYNSGF